MSFADLVQQIAAVGTDEATAKGIILRLVNLGLLTIGGDWTVMPEASPSLFEGFSGYIRTKPPTAR